MSHSTRMPLLGGCSRVAAWGLCAGLIVATPAEAQLTTASVTIRVRGAGHAGIEVRMTPDGTTAPVWAARTDPAGRIVFPRVVPGTYRLTVPAADLTPAPGTVALTAGDVVTITIDPAASPPVSVERHGAGERAAISRSDLRVLPASDNLWALLETVEPITLSDRLDTGGISTGRPTHIGSHGASWTQTTFIDGDVDVTGALTGGTPLVYPDLDALQAVSVVTGAAPAESAARGPALVLVPNAPSSSWHWSAQASGTPSGNRPRPSGDAPYIAALTSFAHGNVVGGGPIAPHAGLTVSVSSTRSTHTDRDISTRLPGDLDSLSSGLVLSPADQQQLELRASAQRAVHPFDGRARLQDRDAAAHDRFIASRGSWRQGSTVPRWVNLAAESEKTRIAATSLLNGTVDSLIDGPVSQLALSGPGSQTRWTVDAGLAASPGWFDRGRHEFGVGMDLSRSSASTNLIGSGPIGETVAGIPARAWVFTNGTMASHLMGVAVYADDRYAAASWLTIDAGVRVEGIGGSSGAGSDSVRFVNPAPRLGFHWLAANRLALFGSYARYDENVPLVDLAFGDPSAPQASVYRWTGASLDGLVDPAGLGPLVARAGPGSAGGLSAIDPALTRPRSDEAIVGIEATLTAAWHLRLAGVATRERHLIALTDPGSYSEYNVSYVSDPGLDLKNPVLQELPIFARQVSSFGDDRYLLTNPQGLNALYEGTELTIDGTARRFTMRLGAIMMRSRGPAMNRGFLATENDQVLPGDLLVDPNSTTCGDGRQFFDPGYSLKWSGSYAAPWGIRAAFAARYQDGQNFARMVIAPDLPQGAEAVRAIANGKSKFTFITTVDAHLEKSVSVGRGRLAGVLEVYNLLKTANEVEEDVISGPSYRLTTAVQPPRVIRLGVRLEY